MYTKTAARNAGGPQSNPPSTDFLGVQVALNVASGFFVQRGQCFCVDVTQMDVAPYLYANAPFISSYAPTMEVVVPSFSQNAGRVVGVYQGPSFSTSTAALSTTIMLQDYGFGVALGSAVGGNLLIGSNLIIIPWTGPFTTCGTGFGVKPAAFAAGNQVGAGKAFMINTGITAAVASGSVAATVSPGTLAAGNAVNLQGNTGPYGLTTAIAPSLLIDTVGSGIQESVTVTAQVAGVVATQTYTVAMAGSVSTLTATTNGVAATYTTTASDTATSAGVALANAINLSSAVSGSTAVLQPCTNVAGVITVAAYTTGTVYNAVTTVAAVSGGTVTLTAGAATLASGTQSTFTATFANAHTGTATAPTQVQGFIKSLTNASPPVQSILASSGQIATTLIPCSIKVL